MSARLPEESEGIPLLTSDSDEGERHSIAMRQKARAERTLAENEGNEIDGGDGATGRLPGMGSPRESRLRSTSGKDGTDSANRAPLDLEY